MEYVARTPQQLGQILKGSRQQHGLTQSAVGSKVGLKQSTVSAIETNGANTTIETLYKALSALGLELVLRDRTSPGPARTEW
jgi:HTH-type transcriptional regulator/antitoxin HipB